MIDGIRITNNEYIVIWPNCWFRRSCFCSVVSDSDSGVKILMAKKKFRNALIKNDSDNSCVDFFMRFLKSVSLFVSVIFCWILSTSKAAGFKNNDSKKGDFPKLETSTNTPINSGNKASLTANQIPPKAINDNVPEIKIFSKPRSEMKSIFLFL